MLCSCSLKIVTLTSHFRDVFRPFICTRSLHANASNTVLVRFILKWSVCSLGRWRTGWLASAVRSLPSSHALKPLIPTSCLLAVMIYGQADKLRNFVADIFIPQYRYPYPVALCFSQVGSLLFWFGLHIEKSTTHSTERTSLVCEKKDTHHKRLFPYCFASHRVIPVLTACYLLMLQ